MVGEELGALGRAKPPRARREVCVSACVCSAGGEVCVGGLPASWLRSIRTPSHWVSFGLRLPRGQGGPDAGAQTRPERVWGPWPGGAPQRSREGAEFLSRSRRGGLEHPKPSGGSVGGTSPRGPRLGPPPWPSFCGPCSTVQHVLEAGPPCGSCCLFAAVTLDGHGGCFQVPSSQAESPSPTPSPCTRSGAGRERHTRCPAGAAPSPWSNPPPPFPQAHLSFLIPHRIQPRGSSPHLPRASLGLHPRYSSFNDPGCLSTCVPPPGRSCMRTGAACAHSVP